MATRVRLLDVNLLIALAWPEHVHHHRAHAWLKTIDDPWATTPITELGFVRLSLNPVVVGEPARASEALGALGQMRASSRHVFVPDNTTLADPAISLGRFASHSQTTDLHLVNLAALSGCVLSTLDRGIPQMLDPADRHFVEVVTDEF